MKTLRNFLENIKGAAAIEFAIVLPVYLLSIFGIIEFGYVLWGNTSLNYGLGYGARYAYVHPTASDSEIEDYIKSLVSFPEGDLTFTATNGATSATIEGEFSYSFILGGLLSAGSLSVDVSRQVIEPHHF